MSIPQAANLYTQGFGSRPENVELPYYATRAPASSDVNYPVGKRWVNMSANSEYCLTSVSASQGALTANWTVLGGSSVDLVALAGDTGTASPTLGSITLAGTANQITTAASGSTVTFSLPSAITAPGSLTTTTTVTGGTGVTATTGPITATNGNFVFGTAGNKTIYSSVASTTTAGANSAGTVTLVGGTATVSTTAVTSSSIIRHYRQSVGATGAAALGILTISNIVNGTSFVISAVNPANATALQASDVSVVAWEIVN